MATSDGPESFEWLLDSKKLRGDLVRIGRAIGEGWLDGEHMAGRREALVGVLSRLFTERELSPGEVIRLTRTLALMSFSNLEAGRSARDAELQGACREGAVRRGPGRPRLPVTRRPRRLIP